MFQIIEAEDVVRVEPLDFSESLNKMAEKMLKIKYESTLSPEFGYIVLIINVKADKVGKILPSDGATYHSVHFKILTYLPKLQEVVEGEVVRVTDFGAFVELETGIEGLIHISELSEERVEKPSDVIKVGDKVYFHITNHEQDFDVPHGFAMIGANNAELLIMPGQTKTLTWEPKQVGVWPFYCTDFCSALHQEMQGYVRVSPADSNIELSWSLGD